MIILDPKGKKDSVPIRITPHSELEKCDDKEPENYRCDYVATMIGLHSVNVFFAGNPIPGNPFGVRVSPARSVKIPSCVLNLSLKPNYFQRQYSSSSFLLSSGNTLVL